VPKTLILTKDAQQDFDGAYQWYQEQDHGLGQEFIRCVDKGMKKAGTGKVSENSFFGIWKNRKEVS